MKAYTGVGSRQTPQAICDLMERVAFRMAEYGWTLRSGAAEGADAAFERGAWAAVGASRAKVAPEIYLPWPRFNDHGEAMLLRPTDEAFSIAKQFHPAWDRLSRGGRMLHARNVHQVLGHDLANPVPSRLLLCWTPDGLGGGGTGQAIRIAKHYGIPVFDLANVETCRKVEQMLSK